MSKEINRMNTEKRNKKALKSYKLRPLKNFFFWLAGVLSGFVLLVGGIFIGVKFVPISTYTGGADKGVVSDAIGSKSIVDAIMNFNTYKLSDMPVVLDAVQNLLDGAGLDAYVNIDKEKLKDVQFAYNDERTFASELQSCITVTVNIDAIGGPSILGGIGNLSIFNNYEKITDSAEFPICDSEGNIAKGSDEKLKSNPKLYYYNAGTGSEVNYQRAFTDDGKKAIDDFTGVDLYFPNLSKIPVTDAFTLISDLMGRLQINEVLSNFGAGSGFSSSFIGDVLDGKKISDLENISADEFMLSKFIGDKNTSNETLYNVLCSAVIVDEGESQPTWDTISIGHLKNGYNLDNVLIKNVMTTIDDATLDLIFKAVNAKTPNLVDAKENLTIGHLQSGLSLDNMKISDLGTFDDETLTLIFNAVKGKNPGLTNKSDLTVSHLKNGVDLDDMKISDLGTFDAKTLDLIFKAVNAKSPNTVSSPADLTVGHLQSGISLDNLKLSDLGISFDDTMLTLIFDAVNVAQPGLVATKSDLTVAHVGKVKPENIKLCSVLPYTGNEHLYKILIEVSGGEINADESVNETAAKTLTINTLKSFTDAGIDKISLATVIESPDDELKTILEDVYHKDYNKIKLFDLKTFKMEDLHIAKVLPNPDENLKKILVDAFDIEYDQIMVSSLTSDFHFENISLSTVLGETSDNPMLQKLLDKNATLANIGEKINSLTLHEMYGANCFVKSSATGIPKYNLSADGKTYVLSETGEYAISESAGVWLFVCYDVPTGAIDTNTESATYGCAKSYTVSSATLKDMQDGSVGFSAKITGATIRQLDLAGVIDCNKTTLYCLTLQGALDIIGA